MRLLLTSLLFILSFSCFGQNWINSAGGNSNDESFDVEIDALGNTYATGYVTGATSFGTTITTQTNGYSDIFVSKSDPSGNFVWVKIFGGTSIDRGYGLALDDLGNIYITGTYTGTANFDSFTLTSVSGSQDIFTAKLDNSGTVIWVTSEGGAEGESAYGLDVDSNGEVVVTGQFEGTSTYGPNTFTSAIDPNTNLSSFDIFVIKYSNTGSAIWSKQGSAIYDDRGLAVKIDDLNQINITGQFSDTLILAGTVINNQIYNAGLVCQLDVNGNVNWLKRLGAYQTIAYDIEVDAANNLYVTGDFQGQMVVLDNTNFYLNGNYTYRYFILKIDNSGHVIWGESVSSENQVSSKAISLDDNEDIYVTGTFKCTLSEYADSLGSGYFNSVGYNDVFTAKFLNDGTSDWKIQYGGPKDDYCSGIAINSVDQPIVSGSYDRFFNFPRNALFNPALEGNDFTTPNGLSSASTNGCTFQSYGYLEAIQSKDIFIGALYNSTLPHYEYYIDDISNTCGIYVDPCITTAIGVGCVDTAVFCGSGNTHFWTHTVGNGYYPGLNGSSQNYIHHIGPYWDFEWMPDTLTAASVASTISTEYTFEGGRQDGCHLDMDTVYVEILDIPQPPFLTDNFGFNTVEPADYNLINYCHPDSVLLEFNAHFPTDSLVFHWLDNSVTTDVVFYSEFDGVVEVQVIGANGCTGWADIDIIPEYVVWDTIVPFLMLYDTLDQNDSIIICEGQDVMVFLYDSLTNTTFDLDSIFVTDAEFSENWNTGDNCSFGTFCTELYPTTTGWYTASLDFVLGYDNSCGVDTILYTITDSFYIHVNPLPYASIPINGISPYCPGDTVNVWVDSLVPNGAWQGAGILSSNIAGDSIFVNAPGAYFYNFTLIDTITSCSADLSSVFNVVVKPSPVIVSNSPDNIICPYDSILLTVAPAFAYEWYGPQGNLIANTQSVYVDIVGFYHCVVTDFDLCPMTSNTIELLEYSTPYLIVDPGTELCLYSSITISVEHTGTPSFNWINPAGITNSSVTITQPGVYICEISQCGITVLDSVEITLNPVTPTIVALSDTVLCPGETFILGSSPTGMVNYQWNDGSNGPTLYTTNPGVYEVTVTNAYGCTGTSNSIEVVNHASGNTPVAINESICLGDDVLLVASGSGQIDWLDLGLNPILTGDSLAVVSVQSDTSFYYTITDSSCTSDPILANVSIFTSSLTPEILVQDTVICEGSSITLASNVPSLNHTWTLPNGTNNSSSVIAIPSFNSSHIGSYQLQVNDTSCVSIIQTQVIGMGQIPTLNLSFSDTIICAGDTLALQVNSSDSIFSVLGNDYQQFDLDVLAGNYIFSASNSAGCTYSESITITNFLIQNPSIIQDAVVCEGGTLDISFADSIQWEILGSGVGGFGISTGNQSYSENEIITYQEVDPNGCLTSVSQFNVNIFEFLSPFGASDLLQTSCEGDSVVIDLNVDSTSIVTYTHNGQLLNVDSNIVYPSISLAEAGNIIVNVTDVNGCSFQDTMKIEVHEFPIVNLYDTTICDGTSFDFTLNTNYQNYLWQDGSASYFQTVNLTDTYWIEVTNGPCVVSDTAVVTVVDCKPLTANVFTPNFDGDNDVYSFITGQLKNGAVHIYNRWGTLVYQQGGGELNWTGRHYKTLDMVSEGVYFYVINGENFNGEPFDASGHITLIK